MGLFCSSMCLRIRTQSPVRAIASNRGERSEPTTAESRADSRRCLRIGQWISRLSVTLVPELPYSGASVLSSGPVLASPTGSDCACGHRLGQFRLQLLHAQVSPWLAAIRLGIPGPCLDLAPSEASATAHVIRSPGGSVRRPARQQRRDRKRRRVGNHLGGMTAPLGSRSSVRPSPSDSANAVRS